MIRYKCVIQVMNYVLDYSDFKGQIVRMIPKAKNISKHKYNQAECLSITMRGYITDNINTKIKHWGSDVRSLKLRSEGWHQLEPTQEVDVRR